MKRELFKQLIAWKNKPNRKPLLLQGARQVGKTYLINQFGKNEYKQFVSLNFEREPQLKTLFQGSLSAEQIIENIELYIGTKIDTQNVLIFFDEIQVVPEAITSLKYFQEQKPEYNIIAAGSLLGVSVGKERSFPVGKVNFMTLYPMSFSEYLLAFEEELLLNKLNTLDKIEPLPKLLHDKLTSYLKKYLFLGGMPEVLQSYKENGDIRLAREIQNEILESYKRDFSKYADKSQAIKTSELWNSIPNQLAKENKKFKYSDVRKNARSSLYESTIEWLKNAGLIYTVNNIGTPKLPLSGYADRSKFKIYLLDTGLLVAMLNLSSEIVLGSDLFSEYNGAFIENYVASELTANGEKELYYWSSKSDAEVDYILQTDSSIVPLEVKSGSSKNIKSLRSYTEKYNPHIILRTSPRNLIRSEDFVNVPLYLISMINRITKGEVE
ncbi:MAG: AAA family ATPase [Melioribacteraceae bacterium]|jgi:predicted AAA+ superfamily ATPase|nr:AAA family ATPase [Melioribacteraceae bacterium]